MYRCYIQQEQDLAEMVLMHTQKICTLNVYSGMSVSGNKE